LTVIIVKIIAFRSFIKIYPTVSKSCTVRIGLVSASN